MIREFLRFSPPRKGQPSPSLSLTADEGTWIRLEDFKDHLNVVLYFSADPGSGAAEDYLRDLDNNRARFEALNTSVFGVSTWKPERLREFRDQAGLDNIFLIYDPFAVTSRRFGACRVRQRIKDTVVLITKSGEVSIAERGLIDVERLLDLCATLEGTTVPDSADDGGTVVGEQSFSRKPGQAADVVQHINSKQAMAKLTEEDSHYILVDVRTKSEYEADHSPLAVHIPVDEIPHRYQELNQTDHIIFLCQMGGRSEAAGEFITSIGGYEIYSVDGGMSSWEGDRRSGGQES